MGAAAIECYCIGSNWSFWHVCSLFKDEKIDEIPYYEYLQSVPLLPPFLRIFHSELTLGRLGKSW